LTIDGITLKAENNNYNSGEQNINNNKIENGLKGTIKNETKSKMEFKTMIHQPQTFSGKMGEDFDSFIEHFDLAAIINN